MPRTLCAAVPVLKAKGLGICFLSRASMKFSNRVLGSVASCSRKIYPNSPKRRVTNENREASFATYDVIPSILAKLQESKIIIKNFLKLQSKITLHY
jgi:hypothetical protein